MERRQYSLGDIVRTKKAHPCGSDEWEVIRVGMDLESNVSAVGAG